MGTQPPSAGSSRNGIDLPGASIAPQLPDYPVNGNGSFVPGVPGELGTHWYAGATYETDPERVADLAAQHRANADKLRQLLPDSAHHLMPAFAQGEVQHWSNTRCVTHDRMPLVGAVDSGTAPSVWMCVGMGSRGLSFAALCAQLLVAQMCAEPWPVEASLARSLQAHRVRRGKR
jgi:tRNA 5-methylaminomethyl-2-thiouridine biosynthesis bifunctional protein